MRRPLYLSALLPLLAMPLAQAQEWPAAIKAVEARGAEIIERFDAPSGLQGYAARYNGQGIALYLTEDGQHVLVGNLLNAQGEDLSQQPLDRLVYQPLAKEMLAKLERSTWIADGSAKAPRIIYMFSDPNCPYCNMFWKQARPWVEAGDVQIRHVMVGMLRQDSVEKAAALLNAKDRQAALHQHESAGKASQLQGLKQIPATIQQQLDSNLGLMAEMGVSATPAIFYPDENGLLHQQRGAPGPDVLRQIMGPRS
ncbi:thiol:disulfide interchange protein DsbG [Pseudomonas sp. BLCC-B13]|uniref:thiol:disulfide interchange protein DsbG n=1 Tax=Pseudomonas sp. BLCC-B13 TaxID=3025314 RepID=UPI00234ED079|nr:thiol:disulfide interchange protein DsbG [Pseudomonas sp. BLCC-B13]MDC7824805.1 thiol:disulfide interchange protein DsbG [Pseudomonas sp. BLCC-B13]